MKYDVDAPLDRSLIEEARGAFGPSGSQRARLRANIDQAITAGAVAGAVAQLDRGSVASGSVTSWLPWIGGGSLATLSLAAIVVAVRTAQPAPLAEDRLVGLLKTHEPAELRSASSDRQEATPDSASSIRDGLPLEAVDPVGSAHIDPAEAAPPQAAPPQAARTQDRSGSAVETALRAPRRRRRAPAHAPEPQVDTPAPGSTPSTSLPASLEPGDAQDLLAETLLMRQVHVALRGENARRALLLLRQHADRFPSGALAEERAAITVVALCASGQHQRARDSAARFLRLHPTSVHAPRVRRTCAD